MKPRLAHWQAPQSHLDVTWAAGQAYRKAEFACLEHLQEEAGKASNIPSKRSKVLKSTLDLKKEGTSLE